jgi:hypothetical protein
MNKDEFKEATLDIEDHFDESWKQCMVDYFHGYSHYSNIPNIGKHFKDIEIYLTQNNPNLLKKLKRGTI